MGWKIENQRLTYSHNGHNYFPVADEIFQLENAKKGLPENIPSPSEELGIRFARIGGQIVIRIIFNSNSQALELQIAARKGMTDYDVLCWEETLPDYIIIDSSCYNLLSNYEDSQQILKETDVKRNGPISLKQYIQIRQLQVKYIGIILDDQAENALNNHSACEIQTSLPFSLKANLYPYQLQGYRWMSFISAEGCGCILGDEMGLGKTLQVIALIAKRKEQGKGPALVVAPVSLLENWKREFEKFTIGFNILIHHGAGRTGLYTGLEPYDAIIISYGTAVSDQSLLRMIAWDLLVVDEAQNIKNPGAIRTKSIKRIPCSAAIAVTGTPFENHVSDLWSLMDFIAPGSFGRLTDFERDFSDDVNGAAKLEPFLSPMMLRRKVADVAQDLPERIDIPQVLLLSTEEANRYEKERENLLNAFDGKNATLPMLQRLRMYCTHPYLLETPSKQEDPAEISSKYQRLCEIMEEISELGEKAILFTSYNKMFEILQQDIPARLGIRVFCINGSTLPAERQPIIDRFSAIEGSALLVLNPRAAGAGLNITAASRVIHYNLEWNPALEDQASARAYRRGQTKTVFVYRLFYKDTVEEIINERIEKKRDMFSAAVVGTDGVSGNTDDILRALMKSPGGNEKL